MVGGGDDDVLSFVEITSVVLLSIFSRLLKYLFFPKYLRMLENGGKKSMVHKLAGRKVVPRPCTRVPPPTTHHFPLLVSTTSQLIRVDSAPSASMMQNSIGPDPAIMEAINRGNKVVFFDVALGGGGGGTDDAAADGGGKPLGRIKLELFVNDCPKTCENFRQFCTGEYSDPVTRVPLGYKNSTFHRVIKDFMIQGGDFLNNDGTGKMCIYGTSTFPDENLTAHKHDRPGMLCMANSGPNSNGCQFYISCKNAEWLDGKHVVFGKVLDDAGGDSMMTVRKCEAVPTKGGANQPRFPLRIVQCGEL